MLNRYTFCCCCFLLLLNGLKPKTSFICSLHGNNNHDVFVSFEMNNINYKIIEIEKYIVLLKGDASRTHTGIIYFDS